MPWYLPRSAGGKRSPTDANESAITLPPPIPWIARKKMSWFIVWLAPASTDPTRNTMMPPMKNAFRPYKSESLPTMGTAVVDATRYEVVTHVNLSNPPRSAMMRGMAVLTTVWSSAARKSASMRPPIVKTTCRRGIGLKSVSYAGGSPALASESDAILT